MARGSVRVGETNDVGADVVHQLRVGDLNCVPKVIQVNNGA